MTPSWASFIQHTVPVYGFDWSGRGDNVGQPPFHRQ